MSEEDSPPRTSILSVINDNTTKNIDSIEVLSNKIDVLYEDIQKLHTQNADNYNLIIKLYSEMTAPPVVKTRKVVAPKV